MKQFCGSVPLVVSVQSMRFVVCLKDRHFFAQYVIIFVFFISSSLFANASPAPNLGDFSDPPDNRPCCGFGYDFEVPLINVFTLSNTLSLDELYEQDYTYGGTIFEQNGLVYSCRGG